MPSGGTISASMRLRRPLRESAATGVLSSGEEAIGHREAERLRGLKVDRQLVFGRCLHGKVCGLLTLEDAVDVSGRLTELVNDIRPV